MVLLGKKTEVPRENMFLSLVTTNHLISWIKPRATQVSGQSLLTDQAIELADLDVKCEDTWSTEAYSIIRMFALMYKMQFHSYKST